MSHADSELSSQYDMNDELVPLEGLCEVCDAIAITFLTHSKLDSVTHMLHIDRALAVPNNNLTRRRTVSNNGRPRNHMTGQSPCVRICTIELEVVRATRFAGTGLESGSISPFPRKMASASCCPIEPI